MDHSFRSALKARFAKVLDFRTSFKEKINQILHDPAYPQAQREQFAKTQDGQYLANVNIHMKPVIDLIDVPYWHVKNTNGPAVVISALEELKAALNAYAYTPTGDDPSTHMEAAMNIVDNVLTDDLQHLNTPE